MVSFHIKTRVLRRWNRVHFKKKLLEHWKAEIASRVVVLALEAAPRDPAADEDARGKQKRGPKRKYDDLGKGPSDGGGGGAASPAAAAAPPASTSRNPTAPASSRRRRRSADEDARGNQKRGARKGKPSDDGGGGSAPPAAALPASTSRGTSAPPLQPPRAADEDTDGGPSNHGDFREEGNDKDGGPVNGDLREEGNDKEPLSALVQEHSEDHTIVEKIQIISQRYEHFRRTSEDSSSCFYRAFLFSYLENLGQMQDRQAEVTRLMKHVTTSRKSIRGLKLDKEYFSNPKFSSVMAEFTTLVNSFANGLSSDELFKSCLEATRSPTIISLLRLLAETDIRTSRGEEYESLCPENFNVIPYCCTMVRPVEAQASQVAIRGLTYALGIPLRVEVVDRRRLTDQIAEVERFDFFPRSEPGKGPDHSVLSYWRSVTAPTPVEMGSCNLLSADRTPLLTLMFVHKPKRRRWYILYR